MFPKGAFRFHPIGVTAALLLCSSVMAQPSTPIGSVIGGPGTYNLAAGNYSGTISVNIPAGQKLEIRGNGMNFIGENPGSAFFTISGAGEFVVAGTTANGITFKSTGTRAVDLQSGTMTATNARFEDHNDVMFMGANATATFTSCNFANVRSGIITNAGNRVTISNSTMTGRGRGVGNGKALQVSTLTNTITINNTTIQDFELGVVLTNPGVGGSVSVTGSTFRRNNSGILIFRSGGGVGSRSVLGTISDTVFGELPGTFPGSNDQTRGIQSEGFVAFNVVRCQFRNLYHGIQATRGNRIEVVDSTFRELKNGISATEVELILRGEGAGNLFEELRSSDGTPPRAVIVGTETPTSLPKSTVNITGGNVFRNIWNPAISNDFQEFSFGDGINVYNDTRLTINGGAGRSVQFERVGRPITCSGGVAKLSNIRMTDVVRGIIATDAGTARDRVVVEDCVISSPGIPFSTRHDAIATFRSFLTVRRNTISDVGGGIVFVISNDGDVYENNVQRTKRNNITAGESTRMTIRNNFLRTTVGDPANGTGLDNVYLDRSSNVEVFENFIMDSQDNGVFVEGTDATIRDNFISGQANDGILLVRAEKLGVPGADRRSHVTALRNTIINQGNHGFKMFADQNRLTASENLVFTTSGFAAPSDRVPSSYAAGKLQGGVEFKARQDAITLRDNVFFSKPGIGIELGLDGFQDGAAVLLQNNSLSAIGRAAFKGSQIGNIVTMTRNLFHQNGQPATIEILGGNPLIRQNAWRVYTGQRLFQSSQTVNVRDNFWGRAEGPANNGQIVVGGTFVPFLTTRSIFSEAAFVEVAGGTATFNDPSETRAGISVDVPTQSFAYGNTLVLAMTKVVNGPPEQIAAHDGAMAYFLPLIDHRLVFDGTTFRYRFRMPSGFYSVRRYAGAGASGTWVPQGGVTQEAVDGETDVVVTMTKAQLRRGWFAVVGAESGNLPPTIAVDEPLDGTTIPNAQTSVAFRTRATDVDGSIVRVEYRLNGGAISSVTTPTEGEYRFTVTNLPTGLSTIEVRAVDNAGAASAFVPVRVTRVVAEDEPIALPTRWYFAEGAAYPDLQTFILLGNPSNEEVIVDVDLLTEGSQNKRLVVPIPPNARRTLELNKEVSNTGVSTVLQSRGGRGFAAERAMYVLYPNAPWVAAHATVGLNEPSLQWYFADGSTEVVEGGDRFQTFILLANPNTGGVNIEVTYLPEGALPIVRTFNIPAGRRLTLEPGKQVSELATARFATTVRVTSGGSIFAERAIWWRDGDWRFTNFMEGAASPGISQLASDWYFAEGNTSNADEQLLFLNPGELGAQATLVYLPEGSGGEVVRTLAIPPRSRLTLPVAANFDRSQGHATLIRSTQPVAVERTMTWSRPPYNKVGGHNTAGSSSASRTWLLPEGASFDKLKTEILLANGNSSDASVTIQYLLEGDPAVSRTVTVPGRSRLTVFAADTEAVRGKGYSILVRANLPVVVERSMYIDTTEPATIDRVAATSSLGIRVGAAVTYPFPLVATKQVSFDPPGYPVPGDPAGIEPDLGNQVDSETGNRGTGSGPALPHPTATPSLTPTPVLR